jgi:3-deoxy-D-manno-octulosonate 8-phosphate phosphatase (KDO 8-P phosphatase)
LNNKNLSIDSIDAFIFDFDGVLTNNLVQINQDGLESVSCSRADGLAFDVLNTIRKPSYIISTEKNPVVAVRAKKLKIPAIQSVEDKSKVIIELTNKNGFKLENIFYVGNDLNDYNAMKLCGYSACPSDSHTKIKQLATFSLKTKGGEGVVRELLEDIMKLDFIQIFYSE